MPDLLRVRTEPCSVCNKTLALGIEADQLKPDVTGLDTFIDLHGLDDDPSHVRLLYIDAKGFVRTMSTIMKFTQILHSD